MSGRNERSSRQSVRLVAVVEDHLLQRRGIVGLLARQSGMRTVWNGETLSEFLRWLETAAATRRPHLLLLDLHVDRGPAVDPSIVRSLIDTGMRVVVFSAMGNPELLRAVLAAGARGVIGKRDSEADVVAAIWTVLGGRHWFSSELTAVVEGRSADRPALSTMEARTLALYASGRTMSEVAEALDIQADTAKKYLNRVKTKYAAVGRPVRTKLELNAAARQDGLIER